MGHLNELFMRSPGFDQVMCLLFAVGGSDGGKICHYSKSKVEKAELRHEQGRGREPPGRKTLHLVLAHPVAWECKSVRALPFFAR